MTDKNIDEMTLQERMALMFKHPDEYHRLREEENDRYFQELLDKDPNTLPFYLYHGTDAKIVRMSQDERNRFFSACQSVIDALWPLFEPMHRESCYHRDVVERVGMIPPSEKRQRYNCITGDISKVAMYKEENKLYEYGDLYLANTIPTAASYAFASKEGGEFGRLANSLLLGAELLEYDLAGLGDGFKVDAGIVRAMAKQPAEPVLFCFLHLDLRKLFNSTGGKVYWKGDTTVEFRYLGEVELNLKRSVPVPDDYNPWTMDLGERIDAAKIY